jgi:hypothetical protein
MQYASGMDEGQGSEHLACNALNTRECEVWRVSVLGQVTLELVQVVFQQLCHDE